ncbi:TetR/AcrR family transcriptional regulator [Ktedonosporobacter rubrisoli]|uniref:TetR/AcrR family transcriptional regulator n=1 Tax=Ktedonosporobacter rubrisoli TaxID=2509675 RepID=A0A4P6JIT5_KTERU|nr:TetR/AcrR family transcriptional regulator [Ktedonosporobacter rubrisoli]QBD75007.1 TetR/AcrR family transcriptional regulator [Ktedonosporobacter rubrisoli]
MTRSVKADEYAQKRNAILDVAQRYITTKGYEQMTTQDLLEALQISRGAFYHYFESKQALLMALVERIGEQAEQLVLPIVADRQLAAQDKLLSFFEALDQGKRENLDLLFAFMRIWYSDENALFRQKLYLARVKRLAPLLSQIIRQGIAEGVFTTAYPDQAARTFLSLQEDLGYATVELFFAESGKHPDISQLVKLGEATADALERVLGMQPGGLRQPWRENFSRWQALLS